MSNPIGQGAFGQSIRYGGSAGVSLAMRTDALGVALGMVEVVVGVFLLGILRSSRSFT